jgi:hypothetical protein
LDIWTQYGHRDARVAIIAPSAQMDKKGYNMGFGRYVCTVLGQKDFRYDTVSLVIVVRNVSFSLSQSGFYGT